MTYTAADKERDDMLRANRARQARLLGEWYDKQLGAVVFDVSGSTFASGSRPSESRHCEVKPRSDGTAVTYLYAGCGGRYRFASWVFDEHASIDAAVDFATRMTSGLMRQSVAFDKRVAA